LSFADELRRQAHANRRAVLDMIHCTMTGHVGGSLSVMDILTAVYATDVDLKANVRSKVVLSKGHAVPAMYAVLHSYGVVKDEEMTTLKHIDSRLQGHPCTERLPEVDACSGLLGQGLSQGIGMAIAKKAKGDPNNVYVIMGDGEVCEGQVWEAATQAAHFGLNNLIGIVDENGLSSAGKVVESMNNRDLVEKFTAFGWKAERINGHDMDAILAALERARAWQEGPYMIVAETVKGKGVAYMEGDPAYHGATLNDEKYNRAVAQLEEEVL